MYMAPGIQSGRFLIRLYWRTSATTPTTVRHCASPAALKCLPIGFSPGQKCLAVDGVINRTPADFEPSASVKSLPARSGICITRLYEGLIAPAQSTGEG